MTWWRNEGSGARKGGTYAVEVRALGQYLEVVVVQVADDRGLGAVDLQREGQEKGELHLPGRARP
jgi:hypothetical protein